MQGWKPANPMKSYGLFVSFCWVDESINKRSFAIKQVVIASCSTNMFSLCSMCIYYQGDFVIFCWAFKQENTFNAMCHDNYPGDIFEPVDACWLLTWCDFFGKSALAYRLLSFLRIRKAKCAPKIRHAEKNDGLIFFVYIRYFRNPLAKVCVRSSHVHKPGAIPKTALFATGPRVEFVHATQRAENGQPLGSWKGTWGEFVMYRQNKQTQHKLMSKKTFRVYNLCVFSEDIDCFLGLKRFLP